MSDDKTPASTPVTPKVPPASRVSRNPTVPSSVDLPPEGTAFTKDPVTITTVIFAFILGVISILLITDVFSEQVGGVLAGIATAAWTATQLLFVKPATVPRQPLEELAAAEAARAP